MAKIALLISLLVRLSIAFQTPKFCKDVDPMVRKLHDHDERPGQQGAGPFCSSLFGYRPRASKTTVTETRTTTKTRVVTRTTKPIVATATVTTTITETFSYDFPFIIYTSHTVTKSYTTPAAKRAEPTPYKELLAKSPNQVSSACSCIATPPVWTVSKYVMQTKTATSTKRVTIPATFTTTDYYWEISTVYTSTVTYSKDITFTTCRNSNPTPSYKLQIKGVTTTDEYQNQWATPRPSAADGFQVDGWLPGLDTTPSKADAPAWNIDCVGRLTTKNEEGTSLYAWVPYYPDFYVLYITTEDFALKHPIVWDVPIYISCSRVAGSFLNCSAENPDPVPLTHFWTIPLYEEYGGPIVFTNALNASELDFSLPTNEFRFKAVV